jgi:hypothetical protein
MPSCKKCDRGFSTNGVGADSPEKCNVVDCPPGHHGKQDQEPVNQETAKFDQICFQCDFGYYQEKDHQLSCDKCPDGKTTVQRGATSKDYCSLDATLSCMPSLANCPADMECILADSGGYECRALGSKKDKIDHPLQPWVWLVIAVACIIFIVVLLFMLVLHRRRLLRYVDENFPFLLSCFELKEGGRRFSLDPTRDTNNLPFTRDDGIRSGNTSDSIQQTNVDEIDRESWSTSDSVPNSTPAWSTRRLNNRQSAENRDLNTNSIDTLNEIRSNMIDLMDSKSVKSDTSSYCANPPILNPNLRVETRPPAFLGLSHRRQSSNRQEGFNEFQMSHQFSSKLNRSGRSYGWTKQISNKPNSNSQSNDDVSHF